MQEAEHEVIHWAVKSDIIPACLHTIEIGSRLSKVVLFLNSSGPLFNGAN